MTTLEKDNGVFQRELEKGKRKLVAEQKKQGVQPADLQRESVEEQSLTDLKTRFSSFKELSTEMSVEEKRRVIRCLTEKIIWDGESLHIFLSGSEGEHPAAQ